MTDPSTVRADRRRAEIGATTLQGDRMTVAVHQLDDRRHVAVRWPYAPPFSLDDGQVGDESPELDGIDVTPGEALALGVLLVNAHDRIERGRPTTVGAAGAGGVMVGRARFDGSGVIGVRVGRSAHGTRAAVGVHVHQDGAEGPRLMWLSLRDARVFAGVLDVLGAARVAGLVRRAVALATDVRAEQEAEQEGGDR